MHAALYQANIVACAMRHDVMPSDAHLHLLTGPLHPLLKDPTSPALLTGPIHLLLKAPCLWIAKAAPLGRV